MDIIEDDIIKFIETIPAEPALASAGVVGDGQTSEQGIQKSIRIEEQYKYF